MNSLLTRKNIAKLTLIILPLSFLTFVAIFAHKERVATQSVEIPINIPTRSTPMEIPVYILTRNFQESQLLLKVDLDQFIPMQEPFEIFKDLEDEEVLIEEYIHDFGNDYLNCLRDEIFEISSFENYDESTASYDLNLLLRIAHSESGTQTVEGSQAAVAEVVINRILSTVSSFKNLHTTADVILQAGQFSPVAYGTIWTVEVTERTFNEVKLALNGSNYSNEAHFFINPKLVDQSVLNWFNRLEYKADIQDHQFRS